MAATDLEDPFAIFTCPPPNETRAERVLREKREARARQISNEIDEQLQKEKAALKRQRGSVRVLFLGQSGSGKSTTLNNLRKIYSRPQWEAERLAWRAAIQLKLVRSVLTILDIIEAETSETTIIPEDQISAEEYDEEDDPTDEEEDNPTDQDKDSPTPYTTIGVTNESRRSPLLSNSSSRTALFNQLKRRLGPLRGVEAGLKRRLDAGRSEDDFGSNSFLGAARTAEHFKPDLKWFPEGLGGGVQALASDGSDHGRGARDLEAFPSDEAVTDIIASCKDDMKALWVDEAVRNVLAKSVVRLEDGADFFLDDIDRIATPTYEPSDDDAVCARLRTFGVQEYNIQFAQSIQPTSSAGYFERTSWVIYDVAGPRTMRHTWLPFFDNINSIIFFASVSSFDERLEEDHRVNRLEDSFQLWHSVCSSKLLANASLVLLLTKCDILRCKLKSGIMVKKYIPSYGERPNDVKSVIKYMGMQFKGILKAQSPVPRTYYCIPTTDTDTNALNAVRGSVHDAILREHLKTADRII